MHLDISGHLHLWGSLTVVAGAGGVAVDVTLLRGRLVEVGVDAASPGRGPLRDGHHLRGSAAGVRLWGVAQGSSPGPDV